jgi:hypothetical protein
MDKRIYIHREGHEFGPLSYVDAQTQLQQGVWTGDTPARFEDSAAWVTLKELLDTKFSTATEPLNLSPLSSEPKPVHLPPLPPPPQPPGGPSVRPTESGGQFDGDGRNSRRQENSTRTTTAPPPGLAMVALVRPLRLLCGLPVLLYLAIETRAHLRRRK